MLFVFWMEVKLYYHPPPLFFLLQNIILQNNSIWKPFCKDCTINLFLVWNKCHNKLTAIMFINKILILLSRFMMGKKVKSQNKKFSLEKEMKMIAIHLSCRHFIPINNPSTEKKRWHERAAVRIFYIDFSSTLSWMEKLPKAWLNVCACFSLEIIKVPTSEKLAFNKMYQQHSQNEPNSILLRLSVGEETFSPVHDQR